MPVSHTNGNTYAKVAHTAVQPLEIGPEYYADGIENKTRMVAHNLYLSPSIDLKKGGSLGLTYTGNWGNEHSRNNSTEGEMYTQNGVMHTYLNNLDAQYTAPFGLRLGASVLTYKCPQEQELQGGIAGEDKSRNSESHQDIKKYLFTAGQEHKLKHSWGVNYGAKVQLTRQASWQETFLPDGTPVEAGNARVDYTERIGSGYLSLSKGFGEKLSLEAGLELEKFHTPTVSDWQAYPTFNLLWSPSVSHLLSLSLGSDSDYPSYWDMMSSVYYSSVYTEIWGNPDLTPSHNYSLNLTYRLRQRYVFTLFADFQNDYFIQLPYQPAERMAVVMQYTNWDYSRQLGAQATAQFSLGKWLTGNASATAMYRHDKSDDFAVPFDRSALTTILSATLNCKLLPKQGLSLIINPFAQFNALQGVYDIGTYFRLNASLRWQSSKGHWAVSAACRNITNARIRTSDTWAGQNFKMDVWQNWRSFALTLTYTLGKYQERQRKVVDTSRLGH
ncbi:MAG: outer membrane beta-barrel family protein [Prevotellaceae bacterium]|nr:outer membrane beta-barrel family protein [Prevotellaceae bacterium]